MLNSEFPISYDNICMNVRHTLLDYENYEANIPRKEIEQSLNKMYSKQDKIREKLDIAESNAMGIVGEWESFNQWFSVLKESNEEMEHKEKDDETELGRLRLAFSSNANQLKSLEGDILCCCRKLPDTKESPQVIRLKCVYSKAKEYFTERSQVLSEIDEEMKIAEEKFEDASKENSTLTEQNSQFEKQLALFSNSESFKLVQDARKHILIKKEWSEKKSKLMSDIQNSTKELENYLGNKDQSLRNLVLEGNKQDQEASKLQSKYNEMIQDIINEDNISNTNRATVMKQLHIELDRLKQNQLRKESNITRNEVRTLKNKGDRLVSKMKMEVSNSSRTFSQALSKLTEPKPITDSNPEKIANFSRFRNVKGKRKKKSPKKKDSLAPKEPPPRVYSLQELAMMKLQEDKEKYALFLKSKFEPEINELRGFLERKINIHDELLQQELSEILAADKRQRDILMANKIRIQQRISEKEIEISSLNTELATFEDMVRDYQQNCVSLEKKNEELKKKSLEIIDPSKFIELRKNIESLDSFIEHTKEYINFLNAKMEDRIENSNQTKSGVKYTDNISYAKNLPRSKSMNDILHADQKAFKKPKVETKKPRVDSALLLASLSKYESKPAKISTEPKAPVKSEQTRSIQSSTTEKVESIEKVEITLRSINSNVFANNSRDDFVVASTINTKKDDRITNVINNNDRVVIETKIEQKETEKQVCLVAENAAASVGDKEEIDKKVESSFAPKEPSKSEKEEENETTHHFTRFAAIESSTVNELHSHEIIAKKAPSAQPQEKEQKEAIQPPLEQIIVVNNKEEEADLVVPESITKVQTEEPQLNVTQPPSCQASTSKPQSQLQMPIQPPLEQADFIRKAPTLGTDMRAFTIEARVSPPTSQTGRRVPTQQTQIPNNFLLNASSRSIEVEHEINVYQKMIDQSTDTYKMVGESEKLQLHERKPRKMTKKTKQQKNADPLVLFSVTPLNQSSNLKTSMNVNSAQINKFDGQVVSVGNLTARRKRGVSATPLNNVPLRKENRFMIYAAGEQQSKKPIVFGARRRAMIESDNNENVYSNCINKVSIRKQKINNKVNITTQKRRNSTINRGIKTK